jgi:hypothetical protein
MGHDALRRNREGSRPETGVGQSPRVSDWLAEAVGARNGWRMKGTLRLCAENAVPAVVFIPGFLDCSTASTISFAL